MAHGVDLGVGGALVAVVADFVLERIDPGVQGAEVVEDLVAAVGDEDGDPGDDGGDAEAVGEFRVDDVLACGGFGGEQDDFGADGEGAGE